MSAIIEDLLKLSTLSRGFDIVNAKKLFKPFSRLHSQKEFTGTGIGLVIVDRIIRKHGGKIWVESVPNAGTSFFFTLE